MYPRASHSLALLTATIALAPPPSTAAPATAPRQRAVSAALPPGVPTPPVATPVPGVLYAGRYGNDGLVVYLLSARGNCGEVAVGGGATALLVDPRVPRTLYLGSGKGLAVSTDACKSGQPATGLIAGGVSALAADAASGTLYAAVLPDVLLSSTDGSHWRSHRLPVTTRITVLAPEPGTPATLLVGTGLGLFATRDGGATLLSQQPQLATAKGINALAVDPIEPAVLFAGTGTDLFRSADAGVTWQSVRKLGQPESSTFPLNNMLPSHPLHGFTAVAVNTSGVVLAGDEQVGLYRSPDHGRTWGKPSGYVGSGSKDGFPAITAIGFDPSAPSHAYVFDTFAAQSESRDGGNTWEQGGDGNGGFVAALAGTPPPPLPTDPVPPQPGTRYVAAARHTIAVPFLAFYQASGGVRIFGLPLTEAFAEGGQRVQVFERARLVGTPAGVTISPLGYWLTAKRSFPVVAAPPDARAFPETNQVLHGAFLSFWQAHRGGLVFGPPISPELHEANGDGNGRTYLVRYFRNARLEYHPELRGTPYTVSVGLLRTAYLQGRGLL